MSNKTLPKGDPAFCFIAPIDYLDYAGIRSDRHLVLAHLIDQAKTNPKAQEYIDKYKAFSDRGDYIICDNSAFELGESYSPKELIRLAHSIGASALVLPDYPGQDCHKTIEAAKEWIPVFKSEGLDTFYVPQGEVGDLAGWIYGYQWAADNPDIDIIGWSILGIPNALPTIQRSYARVVMANILEDRNISTDAKYNHFLGLNAGPNLELPSLLNMGVLDSCDSSGPIWSAINGHWYSKNTDSFMAVAKHQLPEVNFYHERAEDESTFMRILNNVELTASLFAKNNI